MRYYQQGRNMRIGMTAMWCVIALLWIVPSLWKHSHDGRSVHLHWYGAALWTFLALLNISTLWLNYWSVSSSGIDQHGLFFHRHYPAEQLRYAGRTLSLSTKRWAHKVVELQMAGDPKPRILVVHNRAAFLDEIRRISPQADVEP